MNLIYPLMSDLFQFMSENLLQKADETVLVLLLLKMAYYGKVVFRLPEIFMP